MTDTTTSDGRSRTSSTDRGATFIELLVSIVLLGTAGIAVLVALSTSAQGAAVHRKISDAQAWLATAGDAVSDPESDYLDCVTEPDPAQIAGHYQTTIVDPIVAAAPTAPAVDVVGVQFWNSASSSYGSACRYGTDGDRLQLVTLRTTVEGETRTVDVVKRPESSDLPTVNTVPVPPGGGGDVTPEPNPDLIGP